jgi:hypothetical protein
MRAVFCLASVLNFSLKGRKMGTMILLGAIGYSAVYMLAGGGLFGAIVIFVIAKALGK